MHVHTRFWSDVPAHSARPAQREASATVAETWNEFSNVRRGALQHGRRRELRLRAGRPQRCRPRVHNGFRNTMSSDASACTALCGDAEHVNTDGVTSIGCEAKGPSVAEHFNTDGATSIGRERDAPAVVPARHDVLRRLRVQISNMRRRVLRHGWRREQQPRGGMPQRGRRPVRREAATLITSTRMRNSGPSSAAAELFRKRNSGWVGAGAGEDAPSRLSSSRRRAKIISTTSRTSARPLAIGSTRQTTWELDTL